MSEERPELGAAGPGRVIARGASGLRHLRWAREVLGTLRGLEALSEGRFGEGQREVLRAEIERVAGLVDGLSAAVKPYRDFMERARTRARGGVRAAVMVGGAEEVAAARGELLAVEAKRATLRRELSAAIDGARAGLAEMEGRLRGAFPAEVVEGVYPPLSPDGARVLDDGDPDDDSAGG